MRVTPSLVSLRGVDNWWAKWLAGGREALVAQPRGRRVGEHQVLGETEQQAIRQGGGGHDAVRLVGVERADGGDGSAGADGYGHAA
ncbi:hypothetical protein GCM10023086_58320 [Streptomyces venetus]|uniref:Uncharacterized protein n=1 Tax=Streptomyces venetus TaxID=1701086 RepID=A0ABP8GT22_9ACTN